MNRKVTGVIALTLAVGLGLLLLGRQPVARGQAAVKPAQWEYKIYKAVDSEFTTKVEAEFNKLATEGWEFVETIVSRAPLVLKNDGTDRSLSNATCVLFKRLKK